MGVQLAYSTFRELTPGELELVSGGAGTEENIYANGYPGLPGDDFGGWGGNGYGGDYGGNGHWEPGAGGSISDYFRENNAGPSDEEREAAFKKTVDALIKNPVVVAMLVEARKMLLAAVSLENKAAMDKSFNKNTSLFASNIFSFFNIVAEGSTPLEAYQNLFGGYDPGITDPNDRNGYRNR
jgi:hypothetical protein